MVNIAVSRINQSYNLFHTIFPIPSARVGSVSERPEFLLYQ